jgi:hypothetical protein
MSDIIECSERGDIAGLRRCLEDDSSSINTKDRVRLISYSIYGVSSLSYS